MQQANPQITPDPPCRLTEEAFSELRSVIDGARQPSATSITLADEFEAMPVDQLARWIDGAPCASPVQVPGRIMPSDPNLARLWVVTDEDVLHASKTCPFGLSRSRRELKHTNITGGRPAYFGGELIILDAGTVVVNGDSGRYGPRSVKEMDSVLQAFIKSGYRTYTTGYDADSGLPTPLIGYELELVA